MQKTILVFIIMLAISIAAGAQDKLKISPFFDDDFLNKHAATSVNIAGEKLKNWECDLSKYRSIQVKDNAAISEEMEKAVKADGVKAVSRTVSMIGGHIRFGFYALPPEKNGLYRYIIFMRSVSENNSEELDNRRTDLFYIEGKATPDEFAVLLKTMNSNKSNK